MRLLLALGCSLLLLCGCTSSEPPADAPSAPPSPRSTASPPESPPADVDEPSPSAAAPSPSASPIVPPSTESVTADAATQNEVRIEQFLGDQYCAAIVLRPRRFQESKFIVAVVEKIGMPLKDTLDASLRREIESTLVDAEEVILLFDAAAAHALLPVAGDEAANRRRGFQGTAVFRYPNPEAMQKSLKFLLPQEGVSKKKFGTIDGLSNGTDVWLPLNSTTFVLSREELAVKSLAAPPRPNAVTRETAALAADTQAALIVDVEALRERLTAVAKRARSGLPPALQPAAEIPDLAGLVVAEASTSAPSLVSVRLVGADEVAAERLAAAATAAVQFGKEMSERSSPDVPPPFQDLATDLLGGLGVRRDATTVTVSLARPAGFDDLPNRFRIVLAAIGDAFRHARLRNSLKQIGLALHTYHDAHESLVPAGSLTSMEQGAGLSWRVHLLPYAGGIELYQEFHLDEPWDSPHNKKLIPRMPDLYATCGPASEGKTTIHVFAGPGTLFGSGTERTTFREVRDGLTNTLVCLGTGEDKAEIWTKPGGLPFDPEKVEKSLGALPAAGTEILLLDGSVRRVTQKLDDEVWRRLIWKSDGQEIPWKELN